MRVFFAAVIAGLLATFVNASPAVASDVEIKGPHICCAQCVNVVGKILGKVDGVSEVKASAKTKTVTFTAKDADAAKAGFKALVDGGFFGKATEDGKEIKLDLVAVKKGDKLEAVTVKDVHVCCGLCKKGVQAIFKDAKITYEGSGPQMDVRIEGSELYRGTVLEALRKAGFNGSFEK